MRAAAQQATAGGARVRSVVEEVLSRPEFEGDSNPLENLLGSALGDFFEWLFGLMPDIGVSSDSAELLGIVLAVLAGVGLVLLLVRFVRRRQPSQGDQGLDPERAARVDELRRRAREAEAAGDLTLALRLHFFALVVGLGQRGRLVYSDAFTNRELLERGEPGPEVERLLRPLVDELDEHSFGRRPTGPDEVARFAGLCERLLGEEAA